MSRRKASVTPSAGLLGDIRILIEVARQGGDQRANTALLAQLVSASIRRYWRGRGADYGEEGLPTLVAQLVKEYGNSFSLKNLRRMAQFAVTFPDEPTVVTLLPLKKPPPEDCYAQMVGAERWSVGSTSVRSAFRSKFMPGFRSVRFLKVSNLLKM